MNKPIGGDGGVGQSGKVTTQRKVEKLVTRVAYHGPSARGMEARFLSPRVSSACRCIGTTANLFGQVC